MRELRRHEQKNAVPVLRHGERGEIMNDQQLNEIEARVAMTTPGPWTTFPEEHDLEDKCNPVGVQVFFDGVCAINVPWSPNGVFIAHAREDVPALVAEVRRLRAALHHLATESMACDYCPVSMQTCTSATGSCGEIITAWMNGELE